jgi:hypothetical protein
MMMTIQPNVLIRNHPLPQNRRNVTHVFVGRVSTFAAGAGTSPGVRSGGGVNVMGEEHFEG